MPESAPHSFIPKSSVGSRARQQTASPTGTILIVVGVIVLLAALAFTAWSFLSVRTIKVDIVQKNTQLEASRAELEAKELSILIETDQKLEQARNLLVNHVTMRPFFTVLEANTLKTVEFTSMTMSGLPGQDYQITLQGLAKDLPSVVAQKNHFREPEVSQYLPGMQVTAQSVISEEAGAESAGVPITVTGFVNKGLLSYEAYLEAIARASSLNEEVVAELAPDTTTDDDEVATTNNENTL